MNTIEVRGESSADCCVSEVVFHYAEFALGGVFPFVKLDMLAFYRLELALMHPISINVSDNTRVLEIYDGVVDEKSGSGGRVEDVEVVIFDPRSIEIGRRVCTCVKGNGVFGVALLANSYKVSIDPNLSEGNVSCYFILSVLIEEDEGILSQVTAVVLAPSETWMIGVVYLDAKLGNVGDGTRSGREGDSGIIRGKPNWFFTLHIVICHIPLNLVKDLGNEEKVFDGGIVTESGGEDLIVKLSVPQDVDCWEKVLCPS